MQKFTAKQIVTAAKIYYNDKVVKGENGQGLDTAYAAFVGSINPDDKMFGTVEMFNLWNEAECRYLGNDQLAKYAAARLVDEMKEQADNANPTEERVSGIAFRRMLLGTMETLSNMFGTFANVDETPAAE